jgi:hypothetical protein
MKELPEDLEILSIEIWLFACTGAFYEADFHLLNGTQVVEKTGRIDSLRNSLINHSPGLVALVLARQI